MSRSATVGLVVSSVARSKMRAFEDALRRCAHPRASSNDRVAQALLGGLLGNDGETAGCFLCFSITSRRPVGTGPTPLARVPLAPPVPMSCVPLAMPVFWVPLAACPPVTGQRRNPFLTAGPAGSGTRCDHFTSFYEIRQRAVRWVPLLNRLWGSAVLPFES